MNKEELLKAIEQKRQAIWPTDTGEMKPATVPNNLEQGWLNALKWMENFINSLPAEQPSEDLEKEVDKQWNEEYRPYDSGYRIAELSLSDYKETARHFAQWQKEQMMKSAVSIGYLQDWYQNSIDEEVPPIWTDEHLNELTKDFYLIPKQNEDEQCSTE